MAKTKVKNPFGSGTPAPFAEPYEELDMPAAATNGKTPKVKDAGQFKAMPLPTNQPEMQVPRQPMARAPQRTMGSASGFAQGALNNVKDNATELSACSAWGLALSMVIKAVLPGTLNYLAITSLALLLVNGGIKATGKNNSEWGRRAGYTVISAAVWIWFQVAPLMATPEFLKGFFYPSPSAEQVQGE
ncbi:MAG: hypothetical protein AAGA67_05770 [Cyanobacteria bacterium P01_F01_bin.153]